MNIFYYILQILLSAYLVFSIVSLFYVSIIFYTLLASVMGVITVSIAYYLNLLYHKGCLKIFNTKSLVMFKFSYIASFCLILCLFAIIFCDLPSNRIILLGCYIGAFSQILILYVLTKCCIKCIKP